MDLIDGFVALTRAVDCGSFSAAARELAIGQPAVSKRIALLEREEGASVAEIADRVCVMREGKIVEMGSAREVLDDPHKVRRVAIEAAKSVDRVLSFKPPVCHIVGFGDSSVDYILRFWISDPTGGLTNIRGNVYLALWDAFQEHGISIPFPQREVRMLNDPARLPD